MGVRSSSPAPYGPPAGVLAMINGFRDRGLTTPFQNDVYARAGISESLIPRVKNSLEALDLVDAEGNPSPQFIAIRQAKTDEFKPMLADVIRAAYGDVFQFVDPAKDDLTRIADAFRAYEPHGQRGRMVTLFLGLCAAAGIIPEGDKKLRAAPRQQRSASTVPPNGMNGRGGHRGPSTGGPAGMRVQHDGGRHELVGTNGPISPALIGLLGSIPQRGWTKANRDRFLAAFGHVLDFTVPMIEVETSGAAITDDDGA